MINTLQRGERIVLNTVVSVGAALFVAYVAINVYVVWNPPDAQKPLFGAVSVSEVRSQLGQFGDFLNPILTGISLTFLGLSFQSQQREWRVARLFAMATDYNEAVEQIESRDTKLTGRALLFHWVAQVVEGFDIDPRRYARITDAELRTIADLLERRAPLFHRAHRLLVHLAGAAGTGPADQDDATTVVITTMAHQELLLFAMLATRAGADSAALQRLLHARLAGLGFEALSRRIRSVYEPAVPRDPR